MGSTPTPRAPTTRTRIRDEAARVIGDAGRPMHITEIGPLVIAALGLGDTVQIKRINDALHDDPARRFQRVGPGTWAVKR